MPYPQNVSTAPKTECNGIFRVCQSDWQKKKGKNGLSWKIGGKFFY
jgi:hypothetical protein